MEVHTHIFSFCFVHERRMFSAMLTVLYRLMNNCLHLFMPFIVFETPLFLHKSLFCKNVYVWNIKYVHWETCAFMLVIANFIFWHYGIALLSLSFNLFSRVWVLGLTLGLNVDQTVFSYSVNQITHLYIALDFY